jgi:hypothetical protein
VVHGCGLSLVNYIQNSDVDQSIMVVGFLSTATPPRTAFTAPVDFTRFASGSPVPRGRVSFWLSAPAVMSSSVARYESFLVHNASTISGLESTLRTLSWLLPGRFKDAELATEMRWSILCDRAVEDND